MAINDAPLMAINHSSIESHPNEILSRIIEFLPIINRVAIERVSKRVGQITKDINGNVTSVAILRPIWKGDWRRKRYICFCPIKDHQCHDWIFSSHCDFLLEMIKSLPNLKALTIGDFFPTSKLKEMLDNFPSDTNIEHVWIGDYGLSVLDFALDHLQSSKVTCVEEFEPDPANLTKLKNLSSLAHYQFRFSDRLEPTRTLLTTNLVGLYGHHYGITESEEFWVMIFEQGKNLEVLKECFTEHNLLRVVDGELPNLKHVSAKGDVKYLAKILQRSKIESVKWTISCTPQQLRHMLIANGYKLKKLEVNIEELEGVGVEHEFEMFKAIACAFPNLEELSFTHNRDDGLTSADLLLVLGHRLPRLRFLEVINAKCVVSELQSLFDRKPRLIGFAGSLATNQPGLDFNEVTLERIGQQIKVTYY